MGHRVGRLEIARMLSTVAAHDPTVTVADVEAFARLHAGRSTAKLISNLATHVELIGSARYPVPATVNFSERNNAWVCSPHTAYCSYAIEELERLLPAPLAYLLTALCRAVGAVLRQAEIDKAVTLNNWLLSTNIYPALDHVALREWIREARERWPDHAIWFRSLNEEWTADWIAALGAEDAILLPSRQVYLYSEIPRLARTRPNLKADLKLLARTGLERVGDADILPADYTRAAHLYALLYLDKYSRLNPAYGADFIEAWHRAGLLKLTGFRDPDGVLLAVVGTFEREGTVTAPLVGYDTSQPKKLGLYRLLMAAVLSYAADSNQRVNLSAGAAHFKRTRGGVPAIEYSAVLAGHLPRRRQRALRLLRGLTTHIGLPLMTRFKL